MWLQFYRPDHSVEWTALLNSPISVPVRLVVTVIAITQGNCNTKLPWSGDSKGTLRSSSQVPPAYLSTKHGRGFTLSLFNAEC